MRHIIYFSKTAQTSGKFDSNKLKQAGRMDIVIHTLINSLFISHDIRKDVILHLVFYGAPNPPRHLEFKYKPNIPISKKDVAGLIKRMLYKYKEGKKNEVFPGCYIEKKNLFELLNELKTKEKFEVYILDKKGKDIRDINFKKNKNVAFLLGDHEGLPKKELKRLKKQVELISLGPKMYFASQAIVIVHNELDRREI